MKRFIAIGLIAATLGGCSAYGNNRVANGALIGGVGGALVGGAVTGRTSGAVVGGLVGATAGAVIADQTHPQYGTRNCRINRYGERVCYRY